MHFFILNCLSCSANLPEDHWFLGGSPFLGYGKLNRQADVGYRRLSCCCRVCMTNTQKVCGLEDVIGKVCKQTKVLPAVHLVDSTFHNIPQGISSFLEAIFVHHLFSSRNTHCPAQIGVPREYQHFF